MTRSSHKYIQCCIVSSTLMGTILPHFFHCMQDDYSALADTIQLTPFQEDLSRIDQAVATGLDFKDSQIIGADIKARNIYRAYLKPAMHIGQELLQVRTRLDSQQMDNQGDMVSLQELGAFTEELDVENREFKSRFHHGEEHFQTYQLIETAVRNFDDAIRYWRISDDTRRDERTGQQDKKDDDLILKIKLQAALNAIDSLKLLLDAQQALNAQIKDDE